MNYTETLEFIHSFKGNGRRPNLERMRWLLAQTGQPQLQYQTVHIVGTNGKGSTTSYLQHIGSKAGYKVGTFTSPYITRFNERISIDASPIPDDDLTQIVETALPFIQSIETETDLGRPTEFELVTFLALLYFAQEKVDIALIEAGIGGLLDSTNVLKPELVICTSIGLDHTETLGTSLLDIARHKAGVIQDQTPLLLGRVEPEVTDFFRTTAESHQAPLIVMDQEIRTEQTAQGLSVHYQHWTSPDLHLQMLGQHQENNATLAATAAHLLKRTLPAISDSAIQEGIQMTAWPGRSEWVGDKIYLDGAHNPQGIASLLQVIQTDFANRRVHILFAGLKRKPLADLLAQLAAYDVSVTSFDFFEALPLEDYPQDYKKVSDYRDWLRQANSGTPDELYIVTGSLYFISEVRNYLLNGRWDRNR